LEYGVVNAGEVATAGWLMLLWAKGKGVYVDTRIRGAGVVLVRLNNIEVRSLTLREAVLAVELELGRDYRVLTPAVHVKSRLGEDERARIADKGARSEAALGGEGGIGGSRSSGADPVSRVGSRKDGAGSIKGARHLEEARRGDEAVLANELVLATEGVDGVGKGIDGISVVEGLGTKSAEENAARIERRAVVNVSIGLDNPYELLARVVEVELDLVGRRANGLVTRELELLNEVLVGVLGHLAALIRVEEDVVNVEGGSNKGLLVSVR
jgi:hypothetical protein